MNGEKVDETVVARYNFVRDITSDIPKEYQRTAEQLMLLAKMQSEGKF